ncbi:MAG: tyrosine-type recombinase/integrase [Desulfobacteraceae bacterium]|nr:tyrosine-type recombinase/integrase [Desulfobacteraceae bacterium]
MGRASLKLVITNSEKSGLQDYCKHLLLKRGLRHTTINNYRKIVARFLEKVGQQEITAAIVEDYLAEMYLCEKYTYYHITNTIRALERYMDYLGAPVQLARPRKPKFAPKGALSEAEIAIIISAAKNTRERAIMALLAYSGIRNEELCALKVCHINVADSTLFVLQGKGSKDRVVPIAGDCIKQVMEYLAKYPRGQEDYLFTTVRRGEPYNGWALRRMIKRIVARSKVEKHVSPHTFRRSLASNMHARGADVQTIQYILGHSHIETTMHYITVNPRRMQANYMRYAPSYI